MIPEALEFDISEMGIGDSLTVGDLEVPEDVEILSDPSATIISIVPPAVLKVEEEEVEEAEEEAAAEEGAEPEVVGRGKPAEQEAAEEEG
jgi:large subunit ribosomal protein L25